MSSALSPFAEGTLRIEQIEAYKTLYGYCTELVLAEKAYLSMENRNYLNPKRPKNTIYF